MRAAVHARVSTTRQAQAQAIGQQLGRLRAAVAGRGWELEDQHVYRDDGYSGVSLGRPGLDRLRDHAALAGLDVVLVTAPDRLARNYVRQVLLIDELAGHGCQVEFLDRPVSVGPHGQLLLQIRGAVAGYERTLIAGRMRRGRLARLRAGTLLPWTRPPFGYRLDPGRPRDPALVRAGPDEAVVVAQLFDWYLEPQATICQLARRLTDLGVATQGGRPRWNVATVRGILRNPAYAGRALASRTRVAPARQRKSAMLPAGRGVSHAPRPPGDWIEVPVPPVVSEEAFARVQAKLDDSRQCAARNTRHDYLLRAMPAAARAASHAPPGRPGPATATTCAAGAPTRCARHKGSAAPPATSPPVSSTSWPGPTCARCWPTRPRPPVRWPVHGAGPGCPRSSRPGRRPSRQALGQLERQQQRLPDAYLAEVVTLPELERKRQELDRRHATLLTQQRQLDAAARQKLEPGAGGCRQLMSDPTFR